MYLEHKYASQEALKSFMTMANACMLKIDDDSFSWIDDDDCTRVLVIGASRSNKDGSITGQIYLKTGPIKYTKVGRLRIESNGFITQIVCNNTLIRNIQRTVNKNVSSTFIKNSRKVIDYEDDLVPA